MRNLLLRATVAFFFLGTIPTEAASVAPISSQSASQLPASTVRAVEFAGQIVEGDYSKFLVPSPATSSSCRT